MQPVMNEKLMTNSEYKIELFIIKAKIVELIDKFFYK